jgi:hypothetical protein
MGVILFGGAQYSLPEQANLTLIFFGGGGGGEVTKKNFPDIPQKNFPDIPTNILQNFPDIAKKIHVIFAKIQKLFYDISKFFRYLYVLPEFRSDFCPTVQILGGGTCPPCPPPAHTPMALTQRAQTQDKCNAGLHQKFLFYVLFEIVG